MALPDLLSGCIGPGLVLLLGLGGVPLLAAGSDEPVAFPPLPPPPPSPSPSATPVSPQPPSMPPSPPPPPPEPEPEPTLKPEATPEPELKPKPEPRQNPAPQPDPALKPTQPEPPTAREAVGRWETKLTNCSLVQGWQGLPEQLQHRQGCVRLRLEQNQEGLLSVRLINPAAHQPFGTQALVFGGQLERNQPAMRCSSEGRCEPQWPTRLEVTTVASNLFNDLGQSNSLPLGHLAKGSCQLEQQRLECQARDQSGRFWEARASY